MSFIIAWDLLNEGDDPARLREFLNSRFSAISRPSFIGNIQVTELDFGDEPPEITITNICDPLPEFYLPDDFYLWHPGTPPPQLRGMGSGLGNSTYASSAAGSSECEKEFASPAGSVNGEGLATPKEEAGSWDGWSEAPGFADARGMGDAVGPRSHRIFPGNEDGTSFRSHPPTFPARRPHLQRRLSGLSSSPYFQSPSIPPTPPAFARGGAWGGSYGLGLGLGNTTTTTSGYFTQHFTPPPSSTLSSSPTSLTTPLSESEAFPSPEPPLISQFHDMTEEQLAVQYAQARRRESDAQVELEVDYKGNMRLVINTELIVNYPTPAFMVLPLTLTLTGFSFCGTCLD
ncbi:Mitochondrial distribution and morphology protein 12 [Borealophlyctis nickersoniae]|nr:Mitochondrial distribution and morphology protein 12 [Borealophlyctis nickersoniae]